MSSLTETSAWRALAEHRQQIEGVHMRDLFRDEPGRFAKYSIELGELLFDYSKNRSTDRTLALLIELAKEAGLEERRDGMLRGDKINFTEDRPSFTLPSGTVRTRRSMSMARTSCRRSIGSSARWKQFSDRVRDGSWTGFTGKPITTSSISELGVLTWARSW